MQPTNMCWVLCRKEKLVLAVQQWHNNSLAAAFHSWRDHVATKLSHIDKVSMISGESGSAHVLATPQPSK